MGDIISSEVFGQIDQHMVLFKKTETAELKWFKNQS